MNAFDIFISLTKILISAKKAVDSYKGDDPFMLELDKNITSFRKDYDEEAGIILKILSH